MARIYKRYTNVANNIINDNLLRVATTNSNLYKRGQLVYPSKEDFITANNLASVDDNNVITNNLPNDVVRIDETSGKIDISLLPEGFNNILNTVATLQNNMISLSSNVNSLTNNVTTLNAGVGSLKSSVEGLTTNVEGLGETVGGLDKTVEGLTTDVEGLTTDVEGLETSVGGLDSKLTSNITYLEQTISPRIETINKIVSTIDPNTILDHNHTSEINDDTALETDGSFILPLGDNVNAITFDDAVGSIVEVKYTVYGSYIGSNNDVRSVIYEGVCSVYVDTENTIRLSSNNVAELISQIGDNDLLQPDSIIDVRTTATNGNGLQNGLQISIKPNMNVKPMTWNIKVVKTLLNPVKE